MKNKWIKLTFKAALIGFGVFLIHSGNTAEGTACCLCSMFVK